MKSYLSVLNTFHIVAKNKRYYEEAFTHSSYVHENPSAKDYEQMEFIGDGVLDLVVADLIYKNFPQLNQGIMSKLRASLVCGKSLSNYARNYNFGESIRLGHGEAMTGGRNSSKILEDVFEAFIGAYYLDYGYDAVYKLLKDIMLEDLVNFDLDSLTDYKSKLQEEIQSDRRGTVTYKVIKETGNAQNKNFVIEVIYENIVLGVGSGSSKKIAEQEAARDALSKRVK